MSWVEALGHLCSALQFSELKRAWQPTARQWPHRVSSCRHLRPWCYWPQTCAQLLTEQGSTNNINIDVCFVSHWLHVSPLPSKRELKRKLPFGVACAFVSVRVLAGSLSYPWPIPDQYWFWGHGPFYPRGGTDHVIQTTAGKVSFFSEEKSVGPGISPSALKCKLRNPSQHISIYLIPLYPSETTVSRFLWKSRCGTGSLSLGVHSSSLFRNVAPLHAPPLPLSVMNGPPIICKASEALLPGSGPCGRVSVYPAPSWNAKHPHFTESEKSPFGDPWWNNGREEKPVDAKSLKWKDLEGIDVVSKYPTDYLLRAKKQQPCNQI